MMNMPSFLRIGLALSAIALTTLRAPAALVQSYDDIELWAGTGSNRSAMIIQWNDGQEPVSLAWGFQWNGIATGFDMLIAIAGTTTVTGAPEEDPTSYSGLDSRISLTLTYSEGFGYSVRSIVFNDGVNTRSNTGWEDAYWGYSIFGGDFTYYDWMTDDFDTYDVEGSSEYADVDWFTSPIGMTSRPLVGGSWDSWSFSDPDFNVPVTEQPYAAIPEPSVTILMICGAGLLALRMRRKA